MLSPRRFTGDEQQILAKAGVFWNDFRQAIQPFTKDTIGELDAIVHRRTIRFYDTSNYQLRLNDYVFRERRDIQTGEREITLKFRHPDRYISQDRNMDTRKIDRGKTKFEEDIKPPFLKLYSFSTKQKIKNDKKFSKCHNRLCLQQLVLVQLQNPYLLQVLNGVIRQVKSLMSRSQMHDNFC